MLTETAHSEYEAKYIQDVSIEHRKAFAQFFTPRSIAEFMADWIQGNKELNTVLDPSFGLGIFARTIRKTNKNCAIKGFDIDENILQRAAGIFRKDEKTSIIFQDYMLNDWGNRYDGIICNPPYFKFHDYDNKTVINEMAKNLGLKLSGFTNLYALFLLKSLHQLNDGGRMAYVVPSEFLNADYGKLVKHHLIESKLLRYVIIFDFKENVFDHALTTASILLFANDEHPTEVGFINIKTTDELVDLRAKIQSYPNEKSNKKIAALELKPEVKWRAYYQVQKSKQYKNLVPFSTYGKVVRGIATGANKYFAFNQSKARQHNVDEQYLLPCITRSADVSGSFFTQDQFNSLKQQDKNVFLFNATENKEVSVSQYIAKGELEGVHRKFLTASRNPWYALEKRPPAPIWVSVFNRKGLRFVRNEANISNLTTFHCIYTNLYSEYQTDLFFAYLLTDVSREIFNDNRREYGNGLHKFEPNDINKALMLDLNKISDRNRKTIIHLYQMYRQSELSGSEDEYLLDEINEIFTKLCA